MNIFNIFVLITFISIENTFGFLNLNSTVFSNPNAGSPVNSNVFYPPNLKLNNSIHLKTLCYNCIEKCCPPNQYVKKKRCTNHTEELDITTFPVYTNGINNTGKTLKDYFTIKPGKFSNKTFRKLSFNYEKLGFRIYLIESGILYLEQPNMYERWTAIPTSHYCLDYSLFKTPMIRAWIILDKEQSEEPVDYYMTAGLITSCVFLALVLVVYSLLPELRNMGGMILMAYVASLLSSFIFLVIIQKIEIFEYASCLGLTTPLYFSFMSSFCWMNVMSYDIWWTFRGYAKSRLIHCRGEKFRFYIYCVYAFGVSGALTTFLCVANMIDLSHLPWFVTPQIPFNGCFLEGGQKLYYMYLPMLIMSVLNWLLYIMTAYNIWRLSRGTIVLYTAAANTRAAQSFHRRRFMVYVKLSVLMGLNWVLEVISSFNPELEIWWITDAFNAFIGVAIFLIFVCKKKIINGLRERFRCMNQECRRIVSTLHETRALVVAHSTHVSNYVTNPRKVDCF